MILETKIQMSGAESIQVLYLRKEASRSMTSPRYSLF